MHMRVAGRVMEVELTGGKYPAAQLFDDDGSEFSFPITTGEAGIHGSLRDGFYCYPDDSADSPADTASELVDELFEEQPRDSGWA